MAKLNGDARHALFSTSSSSSTTSTGSHLSDGPTDLMQVQAKIDEYNKRTEKSINQSLRVAEECAAVGGATLEKLRHQTDQINRTQDKIDEIDAHLAVSNKHLLKISGIGGTIKSWFMPTPHPQPTRQKSVSPPPTTSSALSSMGSTGYGSKRMSAAGGGPTTSSSSQSASSASASTTTASGLAPEYDQKLDTLSHAVRNLNNLGRQMGETITTHNQMLDTMNTRMDHTQAKLDQTHRKTKSLI